MEHPTDYERALHYFLEEFAGDEKIIMASDREEAPHLVAVLTKVAKSALGGSAAIEAANIFHLVGHRFYHGGGSVAGRALIFFYFEDAGMGLMAVIPGVRGAAEVGRFRLPGGLVNPGKN